MTILKGSESELKNFSWVKVSQELDSHLPTLSALLRGVLPKGKRPIISMIMCMMLKQAYSKVSLAQRVVSVMLYGNSANKQVKKFFDSC